MSTCALRDLAHILTHLTAHSFLCTSSHSGSTCTFLLPRFICSEVYFAFCSCRKTRRGSCSTIISKLMICEIMNRVLSRYIRNATLVWKVPEDHPYDQSPMSHCLIVSVKNKHIGDSRRWTIHEHGRYITIENLLDTKVQVFKYIIDRNNH